VKIQYVLLAAMLCTILFGCKSAPKPEPVAPVEPVVQIPREYHDIELICGNASARIRGVHIQNVLLVEEPTSGEKLIVEVALSESALRTTNSLIAKNRGQELSVLTPGRMLLVGRMNGELPEGILRISSYSQEVAEEIVTLLTKK